MIQITPQKKAINLLLTYFATRVQQHQKTEAEINSYPSVCTTEENVSDNITT